MIRCCLVTVVKDVCAQSGTQSVVGGALGTGVAVASATTTSSLVTVAASSAALASSAPSTHDGRREALVDPTP